MDFRIHQDEQTDGTYRGRIVFVGEDVFTSRATYARRADAKEAALQTLLQGLRSVFAAHEVVVDGD